MSDRIMKIEVSRELASGLVKVMGTPEQKEIRAMEYHVEAAVIQLLAKQFVDKYGAKIMDELSPEIIADEVRKNVARKIYD